VAGNTNSEKDCRALLGKSAGIGLDFSKR